MYNYLYKKLARKVCVFPLGYFHLSAIENACIQSCYVLYLFVSINYRLLSSRYWIFFYSSNFQKRKGIFVLFFTKKMLLAPKVCKLHRNRPVKALHLACFSIHQFIFLLELCSH